MITNNNSIAPHETLELHELLTQKNICATKSSSMLNMVQDEELKSLLRKDVENSKTQIKELQHLMQSAQFNQNSTVNNQKAMKGNENMGVQEVNGTTIDADWHGHAPLNNLVNGTTLPANDTFGTGTDVNGTTIAQPNHLS